MLEDPILACPACPEDWSLEPAQMARCRELTQRIRTEIAASGPIPFHRYMELALYSPRLGYYTGGSAKLGAAGDFVTAPEISPLFGRCLGNVCAPLLAQLGVRSLLEFGAGSGVLAVQLLERLRELDCWPVDYAILELSPELRERQRETLRQAFGDDYGGVRWIERLPSSLSGVILANEVLDAMPVHRFRVHQGQVRAGLVDWRDEAGFVTGWVDEQEPLLGRELGAILGGLPEGYESEVNLRAAAWTRALGEILESGMILLIDYGHDRRSYYHPERSSGTLQCHFRHRTHGNPLILPGLQDITAHVDFTAIARAGRARELEVAGYTTQAHFLLDAGLDGLLQQALADRPERMIELLAQVKRLTLPSQMGEQFKVMALTRGLGGAPLGFASQDWRHRL